MIEWSIKWVDPDRVIDRGQCSQRGSPSVLSQDEDGRQNVVPSRHFLKLPDKQEQKTRTDDNVSSRPIIFEACLTNRNQRRGRTTLCRPVLSFFKAARQVRIKDEDGRHFVVQSSPVPSSPILSCLSSNLTLHVRVKVCSLQRSKNFNSSTSFQTIQKTFKYYKNIIKIQICGLSL